MALVGANAFFVAAEFGLVAARRPRIEQLVAQGSRRAAAARRAMSELNLLLSGCQLGITFASLALGWIGEPAFAALLETAFRPLPSPIDVIATHTVASTLAFAIITILHVVLGELVPKNLAIAAPETIALWVAVPMRAFTMLFRPLIWLFNEGANLLVRAFGVEPQTELRAAHTLDELRLLLEDAQSSGSIESTEAEMVARTFEFPSKSVRDAMVPRSDVHSVSAEASLDDVMELVQQTGHTRFPVFLEEPGELHGVVHVADMVRAERQSSGAKVKNAMREPLVLPDTVPLNELLRRMTAAQSHFAVVLDEYGTTQGIVTRDDVVAELVGDIADEHRLPEVERIGDAYRVPGSIHFDELRHTTGIALPPGVGYETVGGLIMDRLGRLARTGDEIFVDGWRLRVLAVRRRRILTVELRADAAR